jgi:hypothetical protein
MFGLGREALFSECGRPRIGTAWAVEFWAGTQHSRRFRIRKVIEDLGSTGRFVQLDNELYISRAFHPL